MATTEMGITAIAGTGTATDPVAIDTRPIEYSGFAKAEPLSFGFDQRTIKCGTPQKYMLDLVRELETMTGCLSIVAGELSWRRDRAAEAQRQ